MDDSERSSLDEETTNNCDLDTAETELRNVSISATDARSLKDRRSRNKRKTSKRLSQDDSDLDLDFVEDSTAADDANEREEDIDPDDPVELRRFKIRQSNREHAKKLRILRFWSKHWSGPEKRFGAPYKTSYANSLIANGKKITCPITDCCKSFTTRQGLEYHYKRCNLDSKFKCKLCAPPSNLFSTNGEILRHLIDIHLEELPILPEKSVEGLEHYFRKDETTSSARKYIKNHGEAACHESLKQCKSFYQLNFCFENYLHWMPKKQTWLLIQSASEIKNFTLPERESVSVRISDEDYWKKLSIGQAEDIADKDVSNERGDGCIFYVGGVPSSSAWCPIPFRGVIPDCDIKEHIAISVSCSDMDTSRSYKDAKLESGVIQLWSCGITSSLNPEIDVKINCKPILRFGIAHQYGHIWDMSWCPGGTTWQQPSTVPVSEEEMPRLGLLSIACGDGQVRILSIPHPDALDQLHGQGDSSQRDLRLFNVYPVANLRPPGVGSSTDYHPTICKCICWSIINNQGLIAAGYGNGHVAIFDLNTKSPILLSQQEDRSVLRPLKSWVAHGGAVTGITWSPYDRPHLLVTGGYDRSIKFWNLEDMESCLTYEKSPVTKIYWDYRHRGVIASFDTAFTSFMNRVLFRYPAKDGWEGNTANVHRATVWDISSSVITNAIASCDGAGEVLIVPSFIPKAIKVKRDSPTTSRHSVYSIVPISLDKSEIKYIEKLSNEDACREPTVDSLNDESIRNETLFSQSVIDERSDDEDIQDATDKFAAYRPSKFTLPSSYRPISSYHEFKQEFGLKFVPYKTSISLDEKSVLESCKRGSDIKQLYCDRVCDYPFSSVTGIKWSPNIMSYPYLFTATQVGICRLERVNPVYYLNKNLAIKVFSPVM